MLKLKVLGLSVCALSTGIAFSGTMGPIGESTRSVYVGLGGGFNSISVNNKLYAFGISNTFQSGAPTYSGAAEGYSNQLPNVQTTFSPQVQVGFQNYFPGRKEYWGLKGTYQFLNGHAVAYNTPIAQYGAYVNLGTGGLASSAFAGNVLPESAQVTTNHQINLLALMGHSFSSSDLYIGAGPTLLGMQSKIFNAFPFANIDGVTTSQSDLPVSYSRTMWVVGGAGQLGMTYHFSPTWFLDFNYTYGATPYKTVKNPLKSIGKRPVGTSSSTGVLVVNSSQSVAVQTFAITVNKTFGL